MYSCTEALKYMGINNGGKGGVLINIASIAGLIAFSQSPIYSTSKHAIVGFSRCLMAEGFFSKTGIKTHVLCPGQTDTPLLRNADFSLLVPELKDGIMKLMETMPSQP